MIIPPDVEAKIRHICSVVHEVEWSGVLFYSHRGSMDEGNFEVTCEDIYVMDIGSGGYTEYKENASILDYRIQNNLLTEDIQEGLIHSHNNMSTFFSGTDSDTLIEEGTHSNHFVSLIVNNAGSYTARVTRKITRDLKAKAHIIYEADEYYNSYGDTKIIISDKKQWEEDREETKTVQEIEYFNLTIVKDDVDNPFQDIDERLREIKREKEAEKRKSSYTKNSYPYLNTYNKSKYPKEPDKWKQTKIHYEDPYGQLYGDYDDYYDYKYSRQYKETPFTFNGTTNPTIEDIDDSEELPLCMTKDATPEVISTLAAQLLSGDVTVDADTFKFHEFINGMDTLYEEKFGPLIEEDYPNINSEVIDDNNKRLDTWLSGITDFVVYSEDKKLLKSLKKEYGKDFTEIDTAEIIAMDLWRYLDKLPESYVKELMMDKLLDYLPDGAKEYL